MRRRASAVLALAGAVALAGCGERYEIRTGKLTLDRAMSRAFKRSYAATHRMRTGRADRLAVRHADVRCRPRGPQPSDDAQPWRWRCRVRWYVREGTRGAVATYGVRVDERGCFEARSGAFPARVRERVLGREAANRLVYIRSCP